MMRPLPALAVSLSLLASPLLAQGEGETPAAASFDGLWEVKGTTAVYSVDGVLQKKVKFSTVVEFVDLFAPAPEGEGLPIPTLGASTFPTGTELPVFPGTIGLRFLDYFVIKGADCTFVGTVKVNKQTFVAKSFKGLATHLTASGVHVSKLRGKRRASGTSTATAFSETFDAGLGAYAETDPSGAPASTLWHAEGACAPGTPIPGSLGVLAAAYNRGDEAIFHYDTGAANAGALQGPAVAVPSTARGVLLTFDTLRQTEPLSTLDQTWIDLRPIGGGEWIPVGRILNAAPCGAVPQTVTIGLGKKALKPFREGFEHRFRFDTIDAADNDRLGWYVDNVEIQIVE